jgi:flagellin
VKGLDVGAENLQASESRIRDADMAEEMVEYTKNAILVQSATAMLAQANTKTQTVLTLFQ